MIIIAVAAAMANDLVLIMLFIIIQSFLKHFPDCGADALRFKYLDPSGQTAELHQEVLVRDQPQAEYPSSAFGRAFFFLRPSYMRTA